jgi:sulfite reductase (ferredoxin)
LQNGRLKGDAKKALRGVIERYELPVTLTANQNIILRDVQPEWKDDIQATLEVGVLQGDNRMAALRQNCFRCSADAFVLFDT